MAALETPAEVARALGDALERHGLRYAIGGAIALGFYSAPRATLDVDINVFVPPRGRFDEALAALRDGGFRTEDSAAALRAQAEVEGQFRGKVAEFRVDVFVPAIAYYGRLEERRRQVPLLGRPIWVLGPEDLAVLKLMFFRRKDLADVEGLLRELGPALDRAYIRRTLVELVGAEDVRLKVFDEIGRDVGS